MCGHYLVEPTACTPASGWEKGQVENQVGVVRERFFTPRLRVASYEELNAWLLDRCVAYAKAHKHPELADCTIWQAFEAERLQLVQITGPFDGFHATQAFHNAILPTWRCKRNIEMTPLCKIEVTHPRVLGSREVRRGGVVDEQAGVQPS
jgi:hypothetical protein